MPFEFDPDIAAHYAAGLEGERLGTWGRLEAIRTRELLQRHLPPAPAVVLDVGGAEGAYALPLAAAGYEVHLLDPWAPHVAAAAGASAQQAEAPLASAQVGDARELPFEDRVADAVLLLGPLYHLVDQAQRALALREANRVLRPEGLLMAAAISRFASTFDGIRTGLIADPEFDAMVAADVRDGIHRNPDPVGRPEWFTTACFHLPEQLHDEVEGAGFRDVQVVAIEGVGAWFDTGPALDDPVQREALLTAIRRVEAEPSLLAAGAHLMAIGRR